MTARARGAATILPRAVILPSPFTRVSAREKRRNETRERIFEAAIAEFRRVGFERTSISDIAKAADVSRPSIYAHFPTLDHVLFELGWRCALQIVRRLESARTLAQTLDALADSILEVELQVADRWLFRELISVFSRRSAVPDFDLADIPLLTELQLRFERARLAGELRPGMQPEQAARLCLSGVLGHLVGIDAEPEERLTDLRAIFSLYLADSPPDKRDRSRRRSSIPGPTRRPRGGPHC